MPPTASVPHRDAEWRIDALARDCDLPVRTIREYQSMGLLPAPRRVGRIGVYDAGHVRRLQLIDRLQQRGYSLAAIRDLVEAWRDGAAITDVLGLEPDQLVHVDEPGAPASLADLAALLPTLVPDRLEDLIATGVVEACGPDRYCVPSPSLLQLAIEGLAADLSPDAVLDLLGAFSAAADLAAHAVLDSFGRIPAKAKDAKLDALVGRGRGLLAHGLGRLTLHRIGRDLGATDADSPADIARKIRPRRATSSSGRTSR